MRTNYDPDDEALWDYLAKKRGVRMPRRDAACTTGGMERWLKKAGVTVPQYKELTGYKSMKDFGIFNPDFSLRAWAGSTVLEVLFQQSPDRWSDGRPFAS